MTLRKQALALYTPPFRYDGMTGYIVDANERVAADAICLEHSFDENEEVGAIIAAALNAFWEKQE